MKKFLILVALVLFTGTLGFGYTYHVLDSVGVTVRNGATYIIHEVTAGETLYALSRKYGVSTQEIQAANDVSVSNLSIGQRVLIPKKPKLLDDGNSVHVVKSSETLFSISRNYNVQVEDLKKWNALTDNTISVGQKLIIRQGPVPNETKTTAPPPENRKTHKVEASQTLYSISRLYDVSTDDLIKWNSLSSNSLNIGQVLIVSAGGQSKSSPDNSSMLPSAEPRSQKQIENQQATSNVTPEKVATSEIIAPLSPEKPQQDKIAAPAEKVVEKGMAEVIENVTDTKKYLALHRTAPIGTIMQVKNEMNNQTVFVRIVGTIPNAGDNSKVILKISKKAYDRLGAVDNRFPVELSYIP